MGKGRIVLAGLGPKLAGLTWETDRLLRIGRQGSLDIVLHDYSVERLHAEVKNQGLRWVLRDLANSPSFPTTVNDQPLTGRDRELKAQDVLRIGKLMLRVSELQAGDGYDEVPTAPNAEQQIRASGLHLRVQAATQRSWDEALDAVDPAADPTPLTNDSMQSVLRQNLHLTQGMATLVRANQHLSRIANLDDLLRSILTDLLSALAAQRGSIILADPLTGAMTCRAVLAPALPASAVGKGYSKTLIDRCFRLGESMLCRDARADEALRLSQSVRVGTMSSIICALLRTPRHRIGVLHLDRGPMQDAFTENDLYLADALAASVAVGIECAQLIERQRYDFIQTVTTLARAVEMRDQYTGEHTRRVTDYSLLLADEMNLVGADRYHLQIGTPLHDIGKIGIDDAVLRKPGKLTQAEFESMKTHTTKGAAILDSVNNLAPIIPIVKHHHERWDGSGYPDGLAREHIPLHARIVGVADAFDAMTSDRPYRRALSAEQAYLELVQHAGSHFDPECVRAFVRIRARIEAMVRGS